MKITLFIYISGNRLEHRLLPGRKAAEGEGVARTPDLELSAVRKLQARGPERCTGPCGGSFGVISERCLVSVIFIQPEHDVFR